MTQSILVSYCVGIFIFELSYQSCVNNFYRANFYPDIRLGLAQLHQFLSRKLPPAFRQNSEIFIQTDLWNFTKNSPTSIQFLTQYLRVFSRVLCKGQVYCSIILTGLTTHTCV